MTEPNEFENFTLSLDDSRSDVLSRESLLHDLRELAAEGRFEPDNPNNSVYEIMAHDAALRAQVADLQAERNAVYIEGLGVLSQRQVIDIIAELKILRAQVATLTKAQIAATPQETKG